MIIGGRVEDTLFMRGVVVFGAETRVTGKVVIDDGEVAGGANTGFAVDLFTVSPVFSI
jgi:hypothetical protein